MSQVQFKLKKQISFLKNLIQVKGMFCKIVIINAQIMESAGIIFASANQNTQGRVAKYLMQKTSILVHLYMKLCTICMVQ